MLNLCSKLLLALVAALLMAAPAVADDKKSDKADKAKVEAKKDADKKQCPKKDAKKPCPKKDAAKQPVAKKPAVKKPASDKAEKPVRKAPVPGAARLVAKADLTDQQKKKLEMISASYAKQVATAVKHQAAAKLTKEQATARREAFAKAKKEGLKGEELRNAVTGALKLTDAQKKAMAAGPAARAKAQESAKKAILAMLTAEQKAKLGIKERPAKPVRKPVDKKPEQKKPAEKKPAAKKPAEKKPAKDAAK